MIDLRMFLEEDVLNFLEERLSEEYLKQQSFTPARAEESLLGKFSKDYESELIRALDAKDISQAKHVLHALKAEFDLLPLGSVERGLHQQELHRLYELFKQHLESNNTFAQMETSIDSLGTRPQPPQERSSPESPQLTLPTRSSQEPVSVDTALLEKPSLQRPQPKTALDDFQKSLAALDSAIEKNEVVRAHKLYTTAKEIFSNLSAQDQRTHKQDMLMHHGAIAKLISTTTQSTKPLPTQPLQEEDSEEPLAQPKEISALPKEELPLQEESSSVTQPAKNLRRIPQEILDAEQTLLEAITRGDLVQAMQRYDVLRQIITQQDASMQTQCAPLLHRYYVSICSEREKRKHQPKSAAQEATFSAQGSALLDQSERKLAGRP